MLAVNQPGPRSTDTVGRIMQETGSMNLGPAARPWCDGDMTERTMTVVGDRRVGRVGYGAMRLTGRDLLGDYPDRQGGIALLREAVEALP